MPSPEPGRIVLVQVKDRAGREPKRRPVVIISSLEDFQREKTIVGVCISTQLKREPKWEVNLPWHSQGHTNTGLNKPATAVCSWVQNFAEEDILEYKGAVPTAKLLEIVKKVEEYEQGNAG